MNIREFLMMAAILPPWAAFGGLLHGFSVVLERKGRGRKILLWLLAVDALSWAGLFLGPYVLRQFGLEYRCWPRMFLIVVFFLSSCCTILGIVVLCFRQKHTRWLERGGVFLAGIILLLINLYCSFVFIVLTIQTEKVGIWNGEKVVMVAVEGIGHRCYAYHGPVVMGEYLGSAFAE